MRYGVVDTKPCLPIKIERINEFVKGNGLTPEAPFDQKTKESLDNSRDIIEKLETRASLKEALDSLSNTISVLPMEVYAIPVA